MTRPTNHVAGHVKRMHEHMSASQRRADEIKQLAAEYLAANPPASGPPAAPTTTDGGAPSPPQTTESTTASS